MDFAKRIDKAVGSCGALLAVIAKDWLSVVGASGGRCIDEPRDWVRLEIAADRGGAAGGVAQELLGILGEVVTPPATALPPTAPAPPPAWLRRMSLPGATTLSVGLAAVILRSRSRPGSAGGRVRGGDTGALAGRAALA